MFQRCIKLNTLTNAVLTLRFRKPVVSFLFCIFILSSIQNPGASPLQNETLKHCLFTHPFFLNRHWGITKDSVDFVLSDGFIKLSPNYCTIAGNDSASVAAFSTRNGESYLMNITIKPSIKFLSKTKISTKEPVLLPIQRLDSLFCIAAYSSNSVDTLFLAHCILPNKISVLKVKNQSLAILGSDTLNLTLPSTNSIITGIIAGPTYATDGQSGIWVFGTEGMIRYFSYSGLNWSTEKKFDLTVPETVTALEPMSCATISGKIFERSSAATNFTFKTQPCSTAIRFISQKGAVGDNGVVLRKRNSTWKRFSFPPTSFQCMHFISRTNGSGVELLDRSWNYSIYTLDDTPTTVFLTPTKFEDCMKKNTPYIVSLINKAETLSVHLNDPDGNCGLPKLILNNSVDLCNNGSAILQKMHPDTSCSPGIVEVADSVFTLIISRQQISLSAPSRQSVYDVTTASYYWSFGLFKSTLNWNQGNTFVLQLNSQTLQLKNEVNTTDISNLNEQSLIHTPSISHTQYGLLLHIPNNTRYHISFYTLQGRLLSTIQSPPHQSSLLIPKSLPKTLLLVRLKDASGNTKQIVVPNLQ